MRRRTPGWWYHRSGLMAVLLTPASWLWMLVTRLRWLLARPYRSNVPVICIGNLTAGGAGKTPVALSVARLLQQMNRSPVFLSRGYGGNRTGPHRVDREDDTAKDVGDEPLLLARVAQTVVAANRSKGARLAETMNAGAIVMDDGFQNPSLEKDYSILVVDTSLGIGNGHVIPAGPLRAPLPEQLARAHAVVALGRDDAAAPVLDRAREAGLTVFEAEIVPRSSPSWLKQKPLIAYTGIGNPEKFFRTLESECGELAGKYPFPDHHVFTRDDANALLRAAKDANAQLVTTEKDHVRLAGQPELERLRSATRTLPVRMQYRDRAKFKRALARLFG